MSLSTFQPFAANSLQNTHLTVWSKWGYQGVSLLLWYTESGELLPLIQFLGLSCWPLLVKIFSLLVRQIGVWTPTDHMGHFEPQSGAAFEVHSTQNLVLWSRCPDYILLTVIQKSTPLNCVMHWTDDFMLFVHTL